MIFLKLLLSSGFMFIASTVFIPNESSLCYQPSKYVKPNHYDIKLIFDIEENIFYGKCNISISILNKTQNIYFSNIQSEKLDINNIVLIRNLEKNHEDANYQYKSTYNITKDIIDVFFMDANDRVYKLTYNITEDIIDVSFMDELLPGNYIINIKYHGFAHKVFKIFDMKEKTALVAATHFHIIDTQRLPSCWDQQNSLAEATFNISVGCNQCTALSSMPLRNTEEDKYNILWTHFDTTSAMSPYLATIVMSNYLLRVDNDTQNIQMWCRNQSVFHMEFAKNVAENITLSFKNEWKQRSNNISKVTNVAIPYFPDNGIIVFGLVFYNEIDIIYDRNLYPVARKIEVAQLIGRKVTQQWFYNLNNPFRSTSWFNKALTTLLAINAVNKIYPDNRIINLFVVQNQHTSFYLDDFTSQDDSLLKIHESMKAPFILRMMQHAFTKEIFWKHIRSYINSTQFHHQSFMTFLEKVVADAKKLDIDISLQTMEYWALEKHCPLIKVVRNYDELWFGIHVSIQNNYTLEIDCFPVTFTTQKDPNFDQFTHYSICKKRDSIVPHDEYGWMIFNIQQIGYYRVNYDDENWRRISIYLNSDYFKTIHVLNRAQIIDDAFHLMIAGQLKAYIFWNIISYLSQEEDYIAWYPMFKALEHMFNTIPVAMLEQKNWSFKERIRIILNKVLRRIKYEETDDIDELKICLRQEAARWACFLGEINCMKAANNKLKQHLKDPMAHRLLPWWTAWTYCRGLMITTINETTWRLVYNTGFEKADTKFLEFLTCIKDTDFIKKYLSNKEHTYTKREYQFLVNSFLHIITKHAKNQIILTYILDNFNEIKPENINVIATLIVIINNVYSVNLCESIKRHFESIVEANLIEVNNAEDEIFRRYRIKKINDIVINKDYLYDQIIGRINIRKKQIRRQRQYSKNFFF